MSQQEHNASMQLAAKGFLQRHRSQYSEQELFTRAVQHLVDVLKVPSFKAPSLVYLAQAELTKPAHWVGVDVAASGADTTVLIDLRTFERACVPRRYLPQRFLTQASR